MELIKGDVSSSLGAYALLISFYLIYNIWAFFIQALI